MQHARHSSRARPQARVFQDSLNDLDPRRTVAIGIHFRRHCPVGAVVVEKSGSLSDDVRDTLKPYFLLTNRRVLVVVNVGEDDIEAIPEHEARVAAEFNNAGDNVEVIGMCVQLEAEAAAITDAEERAEILEGFGLGEGALFRMVRSAYHLLGLRTYFTTGEQESRAWTFYEGSTAPVCAGRIHTDFQRGFIKAEVIQWDELLELGSWNKAKDVGKMRVEGKDYIAQDGDVMEFRFNV